MTRRTPPILVGTLTAFAVLAALLATLATPASASSAPAPIQEWRSARAPLLAPWHSLTLGAASPTPHDTAPPTAKFAATRAAQSESSPWLNTTGPATPAPGPNDTVIDFEAIGLYSGVNIINRLGPALQRPLIAEPGVKPRPGMWVCHRGVTTGHSCGTIDTVHDGWFRMEADGMTSQDGDSGAPIYTYTEATPGIVGILRGKNGGRAVAVSFPDTLRYAIYAAAEQSSSNRDPPRS